MPTSKQTPNEAIGILFGVAGGSNIDGASGKLIQKQLNDLSKKIDGVSVKIRLDTSELKHNEVLDKLRTTLTEISSSVKTINQGFAPIKFEVDKEDLENKIREAKKVVTTQGVVAAPITVKDQAQSMLNLDKYVKTFNEHITEALGNMNALLDLKDKVDKPKRGRPRKADTVSAEDAKETTETTSDGINTILKGIASLYPSIKEPFDQIRDMCKQMRVLLEATFDFGTIAFHEDKLVGIVQGIMDSVATGAAKAEETAKNIVENVVKQTENVTKRTNNKAVKKERNYKAYNEYVNLIQGYYGRRDEITRIAQKTDRILFHNVDSTSAPGYVDYNGKATLNPSGTKLFRYGEIVDAFNGIAAETRDLRTNLMRANDALNGFGADPKKTVSSITKSMGIDKGQLQDLITLYFRRGVTSDVNADMSWNARENSWLGNVRKYTDIYNKYRETVKKDPEAFAELEHIYELISKGDPKDLDELTAAGNRFVGFLQQGAGKESWLQKLSKTLSTRIRSFIAGNVAGILLGQIKSLYTNLVKIDEALTNLQIVTNANDTAIRKFTKSVKEAATEIGASVVDLINSTTTFARLGYSLEESQIFAKLTTQYSKVANVDVSSATTNLTAILKAYDVTTDGLEGVLDKLIYVGNNYAISSGEIGTAMNNAASSLVASGNSLDQSIAILTAANTTLQDVSKSSTGVRTIAARLTRSSTDLEELGESIDGVMSTPRLNEFMKAFGVSILDANRQLRSTYDVLNDLSEVWDDLSSTNRASIINELAGTRQTNVFTSLMQNWDEAKSIVATAGEASGSLAKATETRLDSIQGKIDQLKASVEGLSTNVLDSEMIKDFVESLTTIVNGISKVFELTGGIVTKTTVLSVLTSSIANKLGKSVINTLTSSKRIIDTIEKTTKESVDGLKGFFKGLKSVDLLTKAKAISSIVTATVAAATTVVSIVTTAISNAQQKQREFLDGLNEEAKKSVQEWKAVTEESNALVKLRDAIADTNGQKYELLKLTDELTKSIGASTAKLALEKDGYDKVKEAAAGALAEQEKLEELNRKKAIGDVQASLNANRGTIRNFRQLDLTNPANPQAITNMLEELQSANNYLNDLFQLPDWIFNPDRVQENSNTVARITNELKKSVNLDYLEGLGATPYYVDLYRRVLGLSENEVETLTSMFEPLHDLITTVIGDTGNQTFTISFFKEWGDALYTSGKSVEEIINELSAFKEELNGLDADEKIEKYKEYAKRFGFYSKEIAAAIQALIDEFDVPQPFEKVTAKSIFSDLSEVFSGFASAAEDMEKYGYLTEKTMGSFLGNADMYKYLTQTAEGWKLNDNALEEYLENYKQFYLAQVENADCAEDLAVAQQNLANVMSVIATLNLSKKYEEETKALEDQKKALEDQRDAYKELIELRKKLLRSMKEEEDYNKELDKKQSNVAKLRTQLQLAALDTSESGKARYRQLKSELESAESDLEDFTLEHAVDVITQALDDQYSEYEKQIKSQIENLGKKIEGVQEAIQEGTKVIVTEMAGMSQSAAMTGMSERSGVGVPQVKEEPTIVNFDYNPVYNGYSAGDEEIIDKATRAAAEWIEVKMNSTFGRSKILNGNR